MKFILIALLLITSPSCSSSHNYVEGNTQSRVEYFGELDVTNCYPNLKCETKNKPQCVSILHNQAKESAKKGLQEIKNKDFSAAAGEFSFALCNLISIDEIIKSMKTENPRAWKAFRQSGFIDGIRVMGMQLMMLVGQCEQLGIKK